MKNFALTVFRGPAIALLALGLLLTWAPEAPAQQPAPKTTLPNQPPMSPAEVQTRVTETAVDAKTPNDPAVEKMLASYGAKVRELEIVIGKLKGELKKGGTGAGSLGNFVTDGMRSQASLKSGRPIVLALMNSGGMRRSNIAEGELKARDIFELLPFENALVTIELDGEQLLKLLQMIVAKHEAQSGARLVYKTNADKSSELVSAKLRTSAGEKEIDPKATYLITTIDYLYRVGGIYGILQEGKNMKALGITLRDAMMNYVKSETAAGRDIKPNLDGRFVLDRAASAPNGEVSPR